MQSQIRKKVLQDQERSYQAGKVLHKDNQYLFYDDVLDDVQLLEYVVEEEMEILVNLEWQKGMWKGAGKVHLPFGNYDLKEGDFIRLKKDLPYALNKMLEAIPDETFLKLVQQLNSWGFSVYDCIYNYNQLLFMEKKTFKKGVSFYQFDNEESVCALQHHFERGMRNKDRFEFTTSRGKQSVISVFY
ncbi:DUF2777 family protein [Metabacillus arenae]|uniref:DUF2777 family protein n=1 Tax=Metabacillus arenae TaxID=2771434 RepID=A0A926NGZ0_9BACI|nr:DUF2777 family protein [Metabacillus arenae]MBD1380610.1 DUF2777 family protein [Metabacillus arenae]